MFWQEGDEVDVEGLRARFEAQQEAGALGYYSEAEVEQLLELYLEEEQWSRARQVLEHARYLYPDSGRLPLWQSRLLYEGGRHWEAYVQAMEAFKRIQLSPEVYEYLIEVCLQVDRVDTAMQVWEAWWEEVPQPDMRGWGAGFFAEALLQRQAWPEAIAVLWQGWQSAPQKALYFIVRLVKAYRRSGCIAEGIYTFQRYLWEEPLEVSLWIGIAQLYLHKHAYAQAAQALRQAEALLQATETEDPAVWGALYRLWARWHQAHGHTLEAFRAWLQARHFQPNHPHTLRALLAYYQAQGEYDAAEPYLRKLAQNWVHIPLVRKEIADFRWQQGHIEEALLYYRTLTGKNGYASHAIIRLLIGYFWQKKAKSLYKLLRYIGRRFVGQKKVWLAWIQEAYSMQALPLALLLSEEALRLHKEKLPAEFYYLRAAVALRLGDLQKAAHALESALLMKPEKVSLFYSAFSEEKPVPLVIRHLLARYVR